MGRRGGTTGWAWLVAGVLGAGLAVGGGPAVAAAAAAPAGVPVASAPSSPVAVTVNGSAANGIQVSVTAPAQIPVQPAGVPLPDREVDVLVKDVSGAASGGTPIQVSTTVTFTGLDAHTPLARLDAGGTRHPISSPTGIPVTDTPTVQVPTGGQAVIRYLTNAQPGTADSPLGVTAAGSGSSATSSTPRTAVTVSMTGLPTGPSGPQQKAGAPIDFAVTVDNPTDVTFSSIDLPFTLHECAAPGSCAAPGDFSVLAGPAHSPVALLPAGSDGTVRGLLATRLRVPAGGSVTQLGRLTLPLSSPATAAVLQMNPNIGASMTSSMAVQPGSTPDPGTRTDTPTATDTPTPTPTPTASGTPTDPGTPTASGTPTDGSLAASAGGAGGVNPTILLAVGLLVLCVACIGGYFYMHRRDQGL